MADLVIVATIAKNCKKFREDLGISQQVLAQRAGVSKQTIVGIEAGRGNPTVETLEVLATGLEVSSRMLITETGNEVLYQSGDFVQWEEQGPLSVRSLGQVYGSGFVQSAVVRLDARRGAAKSRGGSPGMLRHCYVLEGRVELGPEGRTVEADEGDFVRFPCEGAHLFRAITSQTLMFVMTSMPQLSSRSTTKFEF